MLTIFTISNTEAYRQGVLKPCIRILYFEKRVFWHVSDSDLKQVSLSTKMRVKSKENVTTEVSFLVYQNKCYHNEPVIVGRNKTKHKLASEQCSLSIMYDHMMHKLIK